MKATRHQIDGALDAYRDACWAWARAPYDRDFSAAMGEAVQQQYDTARRHLLALLDQVLPR